jgi:thiol-disulfide isomerase/thioredoxin
MKLTLLLILSFVFTEYAYTQEETVYFSDAIKNNLRKYNQQSDSKFQEGDKEAGTSLFDTLVKYKLIGSRFDNFTFKNVNRQKVKLSEINKPIFMITYASWCVTNKGEIQALNKLAQKYRKEVQVIVVFWDHKKDMKAIARDFYHGIKVCYANEKYKSDAVVVATLKHTLGFPTSYFLNSKLDVIDIRRAGVYVSQKTAIKKAIEINYSVFNDRMIRFLINKDLTKDQLVSAR